METLLSLDRDLFLFLNGINSAFWDNFFYLFSGKTSFLLFYATLIYLVIKTNRKQALWIILGIIIVVTLSDQLASGVLKPLVQRFRPSRDPALEGLVHLVFGKKGGLYGFCSSHAANTFGVATFLALIYRHKFVSFAVLTWAIVTSYSRIYLGVHYPLDVICGGAIGVFFAAMTYLTCIKAKLISKKQSVASLDAYIVVGMYLFTLCAFLIFGAQLAQIVK